MTESRPTFLYDGDCAFCSACARFIERRMRTSAVVIPWQFADLDSLGVTQQQAEEAVQWIDVDGRVASGPEGIARLLVDSGSYWRPLGWLLGLRPVAAVGSCAESPAAAEAETGMGAVCILCSEGKEGW